LSPGEKVSVKGTVRLDMAGLDPIAKPAVATQSDLAIRLSAWNAMATDLRPR
jgi:hypothetical protein